ncbi:excisionase family DNA binding protein [Aurantimicrobium minutum]|uniref:helix-turn-helix domain-containing protein n=1 Tax=Aurantimicrobium minutum TaxID=708131 RepID=UPI002475D452|nr:helix-turn-helix domain-containing protein [Aurantimicrobium minutum]MDH6531808.1 excisionase family DNA binding protein [Aurantimicrobium minutum]
MNEYESQLGSTDRFLTVVETAEILKVNVAHVHELIESGELAAFKVGTTGPWRIEHDILELFIAEQYELSRRSAMWNNSEIASAHNVFEL